MIEKSESEVSVVHACKLKNRMAMAECVKINKQYFAVLEHNVLQMIVAVYQMWIIRN